VRTFYISLFFICGSLQVEARKTCTQLFIENAYAHDFVPVLGGTWELGFQRFGSHRSRTPLSIVDGLGLSFDHSQAVLNRLRQLTPRRAISRVDLLGVGNTQHRQIITGRYDPNQPITTEMNAQALNEFNENQYGQRQARLLALSWSTIVAVKAALLRPDLYSDIYLVGPYLKDMSRRYNANPFIATMNFWGSGNIAFQMAKHRYAQDRLRDHYADQTPTPLQNHHEEFMQGIFALTDDVTPRELIPLLRQIQGVRVHILVGELDGTQALHDFHEAYMEIPEEFRGDFTVVEGQRHNGFDLFPEAVAEWLHANDGYPK
jgi:pimeloyl-ACP methyl ester carboxylesterase